MSLTILVVLLLSRPFGQQLITYTKKKKISANRRSISLSSLPTFTLKRKSAVNRSYLLLILRVLYMVYMAEFECAIFLQTFLSINTGISGLSSISSMIQTLCGTELVVYKMGAAVKTICVRSMGKMLQPAQNEAKM